MTRTGIIRGISPGIGAALLSALFFGVSTPIAKVFTGSTPPILLAGLLYLGSGIGLGIRQLIRGRRSIETPLSRQDLPPLISAVVLGGILGPALLMIGLTRTSGSAASLLLKFESVFTAAIAWFAIRENYDRRIAAGFLLIVAGGLLLSWRPGEGWLPSPGWLMIVGACFCWALDNNLTQKISASDTLQIAAIKGLVAGTFNILLALGIGNSFPPLPMIGGALLVGIICFGLSLALFVLSLRHIGTARTSAYFSVAPFEGALPAVAFWQESFGPPLSLRGS